MCVWYNGKVLTAHQGFAVDIYDKFAVHDGR